MLAALTLGCDIQLRHLTNTPYQVLQSPLICHPEGRPRRHQSLRATANSSWAVSLEVIHGSNIKGTLMVVGTSGTGRTTFVNTLCEQEVLSHKPVADPQLSHAEEPVSIKPVHVELEEDGFRISLTVVDTPGFGHSIDSEHTHLPQLLDSKKSSSTSSASTAAFSRSSRASDLTCASKKVERSGVAMLPGRPRSIPINFGPERNDANRVQAINSIRSTLTKVQGHKPSFILVLLENWDNYIYPAIERIGDVEIGLHTVHMQLNKALTDELY